jgi:hypothetical protein
LSEEPADHVRVIVNPLAPSAVRVLGKSMYVLAVGWFVSICWLWVASIQQSLYRHDEAPPYYAIGTLFSGAVPALGLAFVGWAWGKLTGRAPVPSLERREWWQAFWWSLVPNLLLLTTIWILLQDGY